jgi:hypothetical protein
MYLWQHRDKHWPAWPWLLVGVIALIDAVWIALSPVSLQPATHFMIGLLIITAALLLWAADRFRHNERLYVIGSGIAFAMIAWPALRIFNHLTMTTALPWADDMLSEADHMLGLDWLGYITWLNDHPTIFNLIEWTYSGLDSYAGAFFLALAFLPNQRERCFEFVALFIMTAFLCMAVGMFFPAKAAMAHHLPDLGQLLNLRPTMGTYHLKELELLRAHPAPWLDLTNLPGLVTFPSFHTAMGLLLIYVCRGNMWIFGISLSLNMAMITTTPLLGGHYLVDLIGGAVAMLMSLVIVRQLSRIGQQRTASDAQPGWTFARSPG